MLDYMEVEWYQFPAVIHEHFLFVFGGGNKNGGGQSITGECEYYDIYNDEWK